MSKENPTTNEVYVEEKGLQCPFCRSQHIDGGAVSVEGGQAFQTVGCNDCDEEWTDVYQLTGWTQ